MMKRFILLLVFGVIAFAVTAQKTREVKILLKDAQLSLDIEDYYHAWFKYRKILSLDPKNEKAGINAALSLFKLGYRTDSMTLLESNLGASSLPDAKYYLGRIAHVQNRFDDAIVYFQKYLGTSAKKRSYNNEEVEYWIKACENAKLFMGSPHRSVIKNIGPAINSIWADYVPVVTPDENALYFTSRREGSSNNVKDAAGRYHEDIYVSTKQSGAWQNAQNIGTPINTETNDACVAISADGQTMIIYRTAPDLVTGDLYITKMGNDGKWTEPQKMGKEINSQFIETSACFTNDTGVIYFSSNRPGGYGGKDIYRVKRLPNGKWAMPYNLGPTINTVYDEDAPYIHPDGVTMYFSSKGHNTMGNYDVFKSELNPETNTFSKPENLGYPINTVDHDIFFVMSVDGQRAYYSSIKDDTYGDNDIYKIDTRFGDNDLKVKHGIAFKNGIAGKVKITLLDNEGNTVNGTYFSNPKTGKFILVMNPLKSYRAIVEAEGYVSQVLEIKPLVLEDSDEDVEVKLEKK
jgi:tetratricopeptide (TPR) repeat protein